MNTHTNHNMQLTSLLQYFPAWNEEQYNQRFRQQVKTDIIMLLQTNKNLTDRELSKMLGYSDPNKVRPRRNELSNIQYNKDKQFIRDAILIEDTKRNCSITGKLCIAWKISNDNLNAYMES